MTTAIADPMPLSPYVNDQSYISFASTCVLNSAPVIVWVMSNTLSVAMQMVVSTTTRDGRIDGIVIRVNSCQAFAPSSFAASMMSVGTALMAADRTTIA